jgi:hypothetical protein
MADTLDSIEKNLVGPLDDQLEDLERRLTTLDCQLYALLLGNADKPLLDKIQHEVDSQLNAYSQKMKSDQLALVARQYWQKRLLDEYRLPRLSLYYLC